MKKKIRAVINRCPENFILSPQNEALIKELRETPALTNFERFTEAFNKSKDQISQILIEAIDGSGYSLGDVLDVDSLSARGTLSKNMTSARPFTMRLELMQQLRRNVIKMTFDEWLFGKDIPIVCPEYLCILFDMIGKMPTTVFAGIYEEIKASAYAGKPEPRKTIARRVVQTMAEKNISNALFCVLEKSAVVRSITKMLSDMECGARITTLAYYALIKLDVSLDYLIEDDWSYKDITIRGKRITPAQRSFLSSFLRMEYEDQERYAGKLIRASFENS